MKADQMQKKQAAKIKAEECFLNKEEFKAVEKLQNNYIQSLEKINFFISHKLRQPIAHILGLSNLLKKDLGIGLHFREIITRLKGAAHALDVLTRQLSERLHKKMKMLKND